MRESSTSLIPLFPILYKWRKQLSIIAISSFLGSLMISLFLPNYYESHTTFIANNTQSSSPAAIFGGIVSFPYGSSEDNERLISISESGELIDFLIDSLNLMAHFEIDRTDEFARYETIKQLKDQYKVTRNIHGGIELSYEDKSPQFSANLLHIAVNQIIYLDHAAATSNLTQNTLALEKSLSEKLTLIGKLTDSINQINRQYKYASMELRRQALAQASPGMSSDMQWELIRKAANISTDSLASIQEALTMAGFWDSRRADLHANYIAQSELLRRLKTTIEAKTQTLQVIEKPNIPLKKSRPKRLLLVLGVTIAAIFFSILGILVYEKKPIF